MPAFNFPVLQFLFRKVVENMSARPVVKTSFMTAPMQEAAIMAAQVSRWGLHDLAQSGVLFVNPVEPVLRPPQVTLLPSQFL